jgi:hypothetical protein
MKTKLHIKIMAMGLIFFLFAVKNLTAQIEWDKYPGNPVLTEFGTTWAADGVSSPHVIYENEIYKMWFAAGGSIGYSESFDGIEWAPNDDPVIYGGAQGAWDQERNHPFVIRVNDTLKMWYAGSSDSFNWEISIGFAWSLDNDNWNILPDPVLEKGTPGSWDETAVYKPSIYYDGVVYHMWYNGYEGTELTNPDLVGHATSIDGINWVKDIDHNPVMNLGEEGTFFDTWVQSSCVLFSDDEYKMWFSGWDATSVTPMRYFRIGWATSPDGIEWTVQNNSMAILDHGPVGAWDESRLVYPSVVKLGEQYNMWYAGFNYYTYRIGYATSEIINIQHDNASELFSTNIFPNPIITNATIEYTLHNKDYVKLCIYDYLGKEIEVLVSDYKQIGTHYTVWNTKGLPSGVYFYQLQVGKNYTSGKVIKLR